MRFQQTLGQDVRAVGVGLHSGRVVNMSVKPAPPNTGIVFSRTDLGGVAVKAETANVDFSMLQLATVLRKGEVVVQTTEHLMSALYGMGVDNAIVELDGPETPIMDGSAAPFLVLLEEAGVKQQAAPRKLLRILKPFRLDMGDKSLSVEPCRDFRVTYRIAFDHPLIREQSKTLNLDQGRYETQIAPARTFGFLKDIEYLKGKGLVRGGSLDNAIVLDGQRILNDSLRLKDEFVSHKILDLVGDLALAGMRFQGSFKAFKAGHELHARFLKALLEDASRYEIVTAGEPRNASFVGTVPESRPGIA